MSDCSSNVVVKEPVLLVEIEQCPNFVIEIEATSLSVQFPRQVVINNENIGPIVPGQSSVIGTYEAAEPIFANRVVYVQNDGRIAHADKDSFIDFNDVIGLSKDNGATGSFVPVVISGLTTANLGGPSSSYWLGNVGQVLTSAPLSGIILKIGTQTKLNEINVTLGQPLRRN
jgi:hypothetical protein